MTLCHQWGKSYSFQISQWCKIISLLGLLAFSRFGFHCHSDWTWKYKGHSPSLNCHCEGHSHLLSFCGSCSGHVKGGVQKGYSLKSFTWGPEMWTPTMGPMQPDPELSNLYPLLPHSHFSLYVGPKLRGCNCSWCECQPADQRMCQIFSEYQLWNGSRRPFDLCLSHM